MPRAEGPTTTNDPDDREVMVRAMGASFLDGGA
jgi:hypothetical protein